MDRRRYRWKLLSRVPTAICVGLVLHFLFKITSAYKLLRSCVEDAVDMGRIEICRQYPESIEPFANLLVVSMLLLVAVALYERKRSPRVDEAVGPQ